eukprot:CAMPEP_0206206582 /NCGR_PEP_ID=MMETSP0166-20121206/15048_1 /ASSEMBLY_ACC=CAM_ASM_000260 /TAXON_ID=95228 /ORGANISM="Vannella robusta, Strain DIVA3 518/3/11/1/6" /LENGTH=54 /DNA_ID=CAMNT_0053627113 /DNA_START=192 /DNA_END=356 /DNA_ORIENTATION=-
MKFELIEIAKSASSSNEALPPFMMKLPEFLIVPSALSLKTLFPAFTSMLALLSV